MKDRTHDSWSSYLEEWAKDSKSDRLANWQNLLQALRHMHDEEACFRLLQEECQGRHRMNFVWRIHGRYCILRRDRERQELYAKKGEFYNRLLVKG